MSPNPVKIEKVDTPIGHRGVQRTTVFTFVTDDIVKRKDIRKALEALGYAIIKWVPEKECTRVEAQLQSKAQVSARAKALAKARAKIERKASALNKAKAEARALAKAPVSATWVIDDA